MKKLEIALKQDEINQIEQFKKESSNLREINRANILLLSHKGKRAKEIADYLSISPNTVWRIRKKYIENGLFSALKDKEKDGCPVKYGAKIEAELIALTCSDPPQGRNRWTLNMLTEEMRKKEGCKQIGKETIRLILKENGLKPWTKKKCGA